MYDPATHRVHQSHDVVWLHRMFYQKRNNNAELNTNNVSVGNWQNNSDGDLRFVEVGEGVIEDQSITVHQEEENNPVPINNEADESNQGGNANDTSVQHEENNENNNNVGTVTTSGLISQRPARFIKEMGETALTAAEQNYYFALSEYIDWGEYGCVGAGIGSGILNTNELKVIGYDEAMQQKDRKQLMKNMTE